MIISASRRTDIPAFYGDWLLNRLHAGFCEVLNPYNPTQVSRVSLARNDVDAIVFWSKNPAPFFKHLDSIDQMDYPYYFLFTLNDYPKSLEPNLPPLHTRIDTFKDLAKRLGPHRVVWRYDPIIFSEELTPEHHAQTFTRLASALSGSTRRVIISFVDFYQKTERRLRRVEQATGQSFIRDPYTRPGLARLIETLTATAQQNHMVIQSCAEDPRLAELGIQPGPCIDNELLQVEMGVTIPSRKDPGQRDACQCVRSRDIGTPNTCLHGCEYCYATTSHEAATARARDHDPEHPALVPAAPGPSSK